MLIQHKGVCLDVIMFAIFNCCCSGVPVPLCGKTNGSWCCSSTEAQLQEAWPWVGDRVAPQVSICPWCSLWALLCVSGTIASMLEAPVEMKNTMYRVSSLALAFQLLLEPPTGGEGLPHWGGCWPGVHTWARLTWWCPCLLSCRSDTTLAISLSWFGVCTELSSSKGLVIIIIPTYWILFYAFNILESNYRM